MPTPAATAAGDTPPPPPPRHSRSTAVLAAFAVVVLLAGAISGYALGRRHDTNPNNGAFGNSNGSASQPFNQSPFGSAPQSGGSGGNGSNSGNSGSGSSSNTSPNVSSVEASVDPGIVNITSQLGEGVAKGTGMVITSDGEVLTNNHVIDGATNISVQLVDGGATYHATVLGYDATDDVALLKLDNASNLKTVPINTASNVSVNDGIVVIGNAYGQDGTPAAVEGVVTATNKTITASDEFGSNPETLHGLIEVSARVVSGDSGGAVANTNGQVIAMTTAASTDRFSPVAASTTAYAIPISHALDIAHQIEQRDESAHVHIGLHGLLGVAVRDTGADGVSVVGVQDGSAAASAGIGEGDTITSIDGTTVHTANDLERAMAATHQGDRIRVGWQDGNRNSHEETVTLNQGAA
jgi:S1-C subfamily serine protease